MSRSLTPDSSLENLRKEAKRWLKALRAGDADSRRRLRAVLSGAPADPGLRDVRLAQDCPRQRKRLSDPGVIPSVGPDRIGQPAGDMMKTGPKPSNWEVLAEMVERATYRSAENGFSVIRAEVRGHRKLVTMVGHAGGISAGEWITATGE